MVRRALGDIHARWLSSQLQPIEAFGRVYPKITTAASDATYLISSQDMADLDSARGVLMAIAITSDDTPPAMRPLDLVAHTYASIPPDVSRPTALRACMEYALRQTRPSTLLMAVVSAGWLFVAQYGEGRVYHVRANGQIDHVSAEPVTQLSLALADSLLLCSAAVWRSLDELDIALTLHTRGPQNASSYLLDTAQVVAQIQKQNTPDGQDALIALVFGPERSLRNRLKSVTRKPSMPNESAASRVNLADETSNRMLSVAELNEQPKERWLTWTQQLATDLLRFHERGIALGLREDNLLSRIVVSKDDLTAQATWVVDDQHSVSLSKPDACLADIRVFADTLARTKLLEAPPDIRLALQYASVAGLRALTDGASSIGSLRVEVGQATSRGRVRHINEDSLCALIFDPRPNSNVPHQPVLLGVADGMGGVEAGEVASAIAIDGLKEATNKLMNESLDPSSINDWIQRGVQAINAAVVAEATKRAHEIGTTLAFTLIVDGVAYLASVGDSRIYLWRKTPAQDTLKRLVKDHSLVQALVDAGVMSDDERYSHPKRNIVVRSLGEPRLGFTDEHAPVPLQHGDRLLICSDGLWEMVRDDAIGEVLASAPNAQVACDHLVALANANGGEDNVSVVIGAVF